METNKDKPLGLVLIDQEQERLEFMFMGARFYYHRAGPQDEIDAYKLATDQRGAVNLQELSIEIVKRCLVDWEGVLEPDGSTPVPFTKERLTELIEGNAIPTAVLSMIYSRIMLASAPQLVKAEIDLKNS